MSFQKNVIIGWVGTKYDNHVTEKRWTKWRPTISLFEHQDFSVARCELLYQAKFTDLMRVVEKDIKDISPQTEVRPTLITFQDPWDFSEVYNTLHNFLRAYEFDYETEKYFLHLTTGTHVSQICMFLLAESGVFPANLIQTSPLNKAVKGKSGKIEKLDLADSSFDRIRSRTQIEEQSRRDISFLKDGINTQNAKFNKLIAKIEDVARNSTEPILLLGATGSGKTKLARKIYELKLERGQIKKDTKSERFIEVNCSTIRGDGAMSALFGHIRGAFTDAKNSRKGYLVSAHKGLLFLDEIAELGLAEQAMLLRAIEEKRFLPHGSDSYATSDFQLITGTNADLFEMVRKRKFREDLLARIEHWNFRLPDLKNRPEDIEPNIDFELEKLRNKKKMLIEFTPEARRDFINFAVSPQGVWKRNFRDLSRAIDRMATLAPRGRITTKVVKEEIEILKAAWRENQAINGKKLIFRFLSEKDCEKYDEYDLLQLEAVLPVCLSCRSAADATRLLFEKSLLNKTSKNDSDRLSKFLSRFGIKWRQIQDLKSFSGAE